MVRLFNFVVHIRQLHHNRNGTTDPGWWFDWTSPTENLQPHFHIRLPPRNDDQRLVEKSDRIRELSLCSDGTWLLLRIRCLFTLGLECARLLAGRLLNHWHALCHGVEIVAQNTRHFTRLPPPSNITPVARHFQGARSQTCCPGSWWLSACHKKFRLFYNARLLHKYKPWDMSHDETNQSPFNRPLYPH